MINLKEGWNLIASYSEGGETHFNDILVPDGEVPQCGDSLCFTTQGQDGSGVQSQIKSSSSFSNFVGGEFFQNSLNVFKWWNMIEIIRKHMKNDEKHV